MYRYVRSSESSNRELYEANSDVVKVSDGKSVGSIKDSTYAYSVDQAETQIIKKFLNENKHLPNKVGLYRLDPSPTKVELKKPVKVFEEEEWKKAKQEHERRKSKNKKDSAPPGQLEIPGL